MNPHSLKVLEFDKVIRQLEAFCSFSASRRLAQELQPSPDYQEVARRQRLTAEARSLRELRPNLPLGSARDVRELARQAALGHILQPSELLETGDTLALARSLRAVIERLRPQLPLLASICDRIEDLSPLVDQINRCVNQRGEITDAASPALGRLREQVRQAHDRLLAQLNRLIGSSAGRQALQEPIITLRDGRYVVPVKAEMRGQIPGVVHDVSASGATVFLEPLNTVELGNAWRELQLEEQREVQRILRDLSELVGDYAREIEAAVEALAEVDFALAKARLGESLGCRDLPYSGPEQRWLAPKPTQLRLVNARHPLLSGDVVPISPQLGQTAGEDARVLLITGPNTGGKTVALKTIGLLALMAQAGLPVPAEEGSLLPVFDNVFADIGDEQSIEQSLSTFSSHLTNIIDILEQATPRSLVLLDELGAGTDPTEGSALARAILQDLLQRGCLVVATTHHGELKAFAHNTPGVMNASVEFDPETLAPTYRLQIGTPGQSNALAIAQRLGLPEPILEEARQSMGAGHLEVESLIRDLQRQRDAAAAERQAEAQARAEAEEQRRASEQRLARLETEGQQALERANRLIQREAEQARKQLLEASKSIERALAGTPSQRKLQSLERARARIRSAEERLQRLEQPRRVEEEPLPSVQPGDLVWLRGVSQPGEALSAADAQGEVEVALGALKATAHLRQIERVEKAKAAPQAYRPALAAPLATAAKEEVHLRGLTVDEALAILDQKLDEAARQGAGTLRVVHGKGTGTLRQAVRAMLAKHPLVESYATAAPREGGEGVTVVELVR
ncbi:MAG TPA: endonuclease MutS2 [Dehalococcoidia bacterium]|nr:endonuclease MutS2 [Dehalococcoidia bacterium]